MTEEVTISVPDIHCDACRKAIEGALCPIGGIEHVGVDLDAKTVRVAYREPVTTEALTRAIGEQGYVVAAIHPGAPGP